MTLLPISRRASCEQADEPSLPPKAASQRDVVLSSLGSDVIKVKVKNTFLDVQSDCEDSPVGAELHQNGARTCRARLCVASSAFDDKRFTDAAAAYVECTPLNEGASAMYPSYSLAAEDARSNNSGFCNACPAEAERPACAVQIQEAAAGLCESSCATQSSPCVTATVAEGAPIAQQILLQIPLGSICGPESAVAPREHRVMVTNTITLGELQYIDFRVVLGPQGSLSTPANLELAMAPARADDDADSTCSTAALPRPVGLVSSEDLSMGVASTNSLASTKGLQTVCSTTDASLVQPATSWPMDALTTLRDSQRKAIVNEDDDSHGKTRMVCRHWKLKGWCKFQANCKFMHPEHKKGVGATLLQSMAPDQKHQKTVAATLLQSMMPDQKHLKTAGPTTFVMQSGRIC